MTSHFAGAEQLKYIQIGPWSPTVSWWDTRIHQHVFIYHSLYIHSLLICYAYYFNPKQQCSLGQLSSQRWPNLHCSLGWYCTFAIWVSVHYKLLFQCTTNLNYAVLGTANMENQAVSVERLCEYAKCPQEVGPSVHCKIGARLTPLSAHFEHQLTLLLTQNPLCTYDNSIQQCLHNVTLTTMLCYTWVW